jgi:hypothetical protein
LIVGFATVLAEPEPFRGEIMSPPQPASTANAAITRRLDIKRVIPAVSCAA